MSDTNDIMDGDGLQNDEGGLIPQNDEGGAVPQNKDGNLGSLQNDELGDISRQDDDDDQRLHDTPTRKRVKKRRSSR